MCGIAGIIYRDGTHEIGRDMTRMLQSMKHRGPDRPVTRSTARRRRARRHALHAGRREHAARLRVRRAARAAPGPGRPAAKAAGADIRDVEQETEYAYRVTFSYDGDLKDLTDRIEDIPDAEVLSIGRSLEIVKDLGDADTVCAQYELDDFGGTHAIGHVRMATESDVDISGAHPYWAYPSRTSPSCTTAS